jgi:hypothetical protein
VLSNETEAGAIEAAHRTALAGFNGYELWSAGTKVAAHFFNPRPSQRPPMPPDGQQGGHRVPFRSNAVQMS